MKKKFAKITKLILFFLIIATVCYGGYKAWQAYQEYLRQEMTQTLTIDGEVFKNYPRWHANFLKALMSLRQKRFRRA